MTPAAAIASLDRQLAAIGEDVILRRTIGTANQVNIDVVCRAFVRGYEPKELVGSIVQGDSQVTISPTQINRAQWPGGQPVTSPPSATDPRVPRKGDKMIVAGKPRNVEAAAPIYLAGELVRIDLQVKG